MPCGILENLYFAFDVTDEDVVQEKTKDDYVGKAITLSSGWMWTSWVIIQKPRIAAMIFSLDSVPVILTM